MTNPMIETLTRNAVHKRDHNHEPGEHCSNPIECISLGQTLWFAVCHDCHDETALGNKDHVKDYSTRHRCACQ